MINLPDRCQRQIGRVAHRAFEGGKRRIVRVAPLWQGKPTGNLLWQSGLTLLAPNVFDSYYDPCDQDIGVSHTLGSCSFSVLTIAFSIPQGIARGSSQVVKHWGPAGVTELRSGDWVMTGGASFRNWVMAGAKTSRQGWQASITTTVPKASLRYPSGWEWWKGLIGQRVYKP